MNDAVHVPLSQRINIRMIVFAAVVLFIVGCPLYWAVDMAMSRGIKDHGSYKEVDLKAISMFDIRDPANAADDDVPPEFRALDGKRVLLVGEMVLSNSVGRQASFDLVYSVQKCCLSGAPLIQHFVKATVLPNHRVEYHPGLVKVLGTFHVGIEKENGQILSIYRIDVESADPA